MLNYEVKQKLEELKDCEYITITTEDGYVHNVDYRTIINDESNGRLLIDFDSKSYAYSRILDIQHSF